MLSSLRGRWLLTCVVLLAWGLVQSVHAQPPAGAATPRQNVDEDFWYLLWFGAGWFGFVTMVLLALCSIAALAVAIENFLTVRRKVLLPANLADAAYKYISAGEPAKVEQLCQQHPSFLSAVIQAGLQEARHGYEAAEKAMEDAAQDQNARLHRKIEYLNILSSVGPMLGLLGTVWGMVVAFEQVARTQGRADPGQLAGGIYQALYTTVFGLVIAIPGLSCYGILRNRVDNLSAEVAMLAERVFSPFKRGKVARKPSAPSEAAVSPPVSDKGAAIPPVRKETGG